MMCRESGRVRSGRWCRSSRPLSGWGSRSPMPRQRDNPPDEPGIVRQREGDQPRRPNAAAGTPSKGLMQMVDATYQAYRDKWVWSTIFEWLQ